MEFIRQIVFVTGFNIINPLTIGQSLSNLLCFKYIDIDSIYSKILDISDYRKIDFNMLKNLEYSSEITSLKLKHYRKLLDGFSGNVVIEGIPLIFKHDRVIIDEIIGTHWKTFFFIKSSSKWEKNNFRLKLKDFKELASQIINYFEEPKHFYMIDDPNTLFIDYIQQYQRAGLTDVKWKLLDLKFLEDKTVLDCGCNAGWIGKYCIERGAAKVLGIDNNWWYLEQARAKGIETKLMNLEQIEQITDKYDYVICLSVMHYINNKEQFIRHIASITKEQFIVEIPILQENGLKIGKKTSYSTITIPTEELMLKWLKNYFDKVEIMGKSVSPNDSYRLIFKAYKQLNTSRLKA